VSDDDVVFGAPAGQAKPTRLSALRKAIQAQERLNSRIVRIAKPETCVWELDLRIPTDGYELEEVSKQAAERLKKSGGQVSNMRLQLHVCAGLLARYTVAIWDSGQDDPIVDARADRDAAFADEGVLAELGVKDSIAAVFALFQADPTIIAFGEEFIDEYAGDAEAFTIEDPTAGD